MTPLQYGTPEYEREAAKYDRGDPRHPANRDFVGDAMPRSSSPTRALVEYREAPPVTRPFHVPTPPNPFRGRSYPLILSDSCGIAASIQGDPTLPRFTPVSIPRDIGDAQRERDARRVDAHQRARILRDAATRLASRGHLEGLFTRGAIAAATLAAKRQERIGNGEYIPPARDRRALSQVAHDSSFPTGVRADAAAMLARIR